MMRLKLIVICLLYLTTNCIAQTNPVFSNEKAVTINGLTFDAMEPHLSTDGNALFFNSLNDAVTTSLYYAAKVNDSVFNFIGLVPIVNQTITPRLNAVASLDTSNNFYWVSLQNYPNENLHRIKFLPNTYSNYGLVYGDFYVFGAGNLIMDAAINYNGDKLIYCNAFFGSCANGMPCKSSMGMATKINDSTFNKLPNTSSLFFNVNDTVNYIVYAPCLSKDELELYYTRLLKNGTQTEIMVATRSNTNNAFGMPSVLVTAPNVLPEAVTITSDMSKIYYHKKIGSTYKIFYQTRQLATSLNQEKNDVADLSVYPNPVSNYLYIKNIDKNIPFKVDVYTLDGKFIKTFYNEYKLNVKDFDAANYLLHITQNKTTKQFKFIKE